MRLEYREWKGKTNPVWKRLGVIVMWVMKRSMSSISFILTFLVAAFFILLVGAIYITAPHDMVKKEFFVNVFTNGVLYIFIVILVASITSWLISYDLKNNSFVLYFSRGIKPEQYMVAKLLGAFLTVAIVTAVLPGLIGILMMATQTADDKYWDSMVIIGKVMARGALYAFMFIPVGIFISTLTPKKLYASISTFLSIFILGAVSGILSNFDETWRNMDPLYALQYVALKVLDVDMDDFKVVKHSEYVYVFILVLIFAPLAMTYYTVYRRSISG